MSLRVDVAGWKMQFGVKTNGSWFDPNSYPSVPYVFNLLMDPMEKMDPASHEWGYIGRKFSVEKLWAPIAAGPFIAALLQSLNDYPPRQDADMLSMRKAIDETMRTIEKPNNSSD